MQQGQEPGRGPANQQPSSRQPEPGPRNQRGPDQRAADQRPPASRDADNRGQDRRAPAGNGYDQRGPANRDPDDRGQDRRAPAAGGNDQRGPANRPPNERPRQQDQNRTNQRPPQERQPDDRPQNDRGPADRGQDTRGQDSRGYDDPGQDNRRQQQTVADPEDRRPPPRDADDNQALANRDDQNQGARGLAPTSQGTVESISPREQRNFIGLISTNSAAAKRGEAKPGLYHSRNLGSFDTVTAEVLGHFYRQRYQMWDERANVFQTYCEAAAPTIDLLYGEGQPGGRCTDCGLTQWRETQIEGTTRTKNQPPLCSENVVFELFIHEVAAPAYWEVSSSDNLDTIRNTINILTERHGWGGYVIQLYSTMQMSSRNEPRFTPHIRHRADLHPFHSSNVLEGPRPGPPTRAPTRP